MAGHDQNGTLNFDDVQELVNAFKDAYRKSNLDIAGERALVEFSDHFTRFADVPNNVNSALEFVQRPTNFRDQVAYSTNGQLTVGEAWDRYEGAALNSAWFDNEDENSAVIVDSNDWANSFNRKKMGVYNYMLNSISPDAKYTLDDATARQLGMIREMGNLPAGYQEIGRGLDSYGNANPWTGGIWNDYDRSARHRTEVPSAEYAEETQTPDRSRDDRDPGPYETFNPLPVMTVKGTGTNSEGHVIVHTKNTYDTGASYTYSENKNTGVTTVSGQTRTGSTLSGSYDEDGNGSITTTHTNGASVTWTMTDGGMDMPVVLDLDRDGIEINTNYDVAFDFDEDGFVERGAWAAADDGFLVIDLNANGALGSGDGKINQRKEIILSEWGSKNATDLQALAQAKASDGSLLFDSNGDGRLTNADTHFGKFRIWRDRDQDGRVDAGELKTLSAMKISQINLRYDNGKSYSNDSDDVDLGVASLMGRASYVRDGVTIKGGVGDVGLSFEKMGTKRANFDWGYSVDHEAKGVRTEYHRIFDADDLNFNLTSGTQNWVRVTGNAQNNSLNAEDKKVSVSLEGKGGNDVLRGGYASDRLHGGSGADKLYGGGGRDVIITGTGNDYVHAGDGNDVIVSANFQGRFHGGHGNDTIDFSASTTRIALRLYDDEYNDHLVQMWSIENLIGSDTEGDYLSGNAGDNVLTGLGGSDVLSGREGHDTLSGGLGADSLSGGDGNDTLFGGRGNDTHKGGNGNDRMIDAFGSDAFDGGSGFDTVSYSQSNKGINANLKTGANNSSDTYTSIEGLIGSAAWHDHLIGSDFSNLLVGGGGDDRLEGLGGNDSLFGDIGDDTLFGHDGDDILKGGSGEDRLYGGKGSDELRGGSGDDYLRDDSGHDRFYGGAGNDTVSYYGHTAGMTANLATGANSGGDTYSGIENLMGSSTAADKLTGDEKANKLHGLGGADSLHGGGGDDRLYGGDGADALRGGSGSDRLYGGNGADSLHGDAGDDLLDGGSGNDGLYGGTGHDRLLGGAGNDLLSDGSGKNTFDGGSGIDTVSHAAQTYGLSVDLSKGSNTRGDTYVSIENVWGSDTAGDNLIGSSAGNQLHGGGGADVIYGRGGSDSLKGGAGADKLYGESGADKLYGGDGGDLLVGGTGADRLYGGKGNDNLLGGDGDDYLRDESGADTFNGGAGRDTASYYGNSSGMTVNLATGYNTGGDTYISIENLLGSNLAADRLIGSSGANVLKGAGGRDTLLGGGGNDKLYGGTGADILNGQTGNDLLIGGAGADTFRFNFKSGHDRILDFELGIDKIELRGFKAQGLRDIGDLNISQKAGDTILKLSSAHSLTIDDVTTGQLDSIFVFV